MFAPAVFGGNQTAGIKLDYARPGLFPVGFPGHFLQEVFLMGSVSRRASARGGAGSAAEGAERPSLVESPFFAVSLLYALAVSVRLWLSHFQPHIFLYTDEILLLEASRSLADGHAVAVRSVPYGFSHVLYPLLIAPSHWISDGMISYAVLRAINSFVMNSAIFPAYLISARLAPKSALFVAALSVLVPDLCFASSVFAEVLLYPAAMWFFLFMCNYLADGGAKWLAGVVVSGILIYFVKAAGAALLAGFALFLVVRAFAGGSFAKRVVIASSFAAAIALIVLFANGFLTGYVINFGYFMDAGRVLAMIRYMLYFVAFASVAFGFYFMVLPALCLQSLDRTARDFYLAVLSCFLATVFAVVLVVSMYEDYPSSAMTPHLRYLFHFSIPFAVVFLACSPESFPAYGKIASIVFALFVQWGVCRFPEGNYTAFMDLAYLRESLAAPFASVDLGFLRVKGSLFDAVKFLFLAVTAYASYLVFRDRAGALKVFFSVLFVALCAFNNALCFSAGRSMMNPDAPALIAQMEALNDALGRSRILLIGRYAGSEKVFETYTKQRYWYTTSAMYGYFQGASYSSGLPVPLVSMQWSLQRDPELAKASKWSKPDVSVDVVDPVVERISPDFIVLGASAVGMPIYPRRTLYPLLIPGVYSYRVYRVGGAGE